MNRKKIIISTLILSLFSINQVYASCTKEELEEFKKIEKEYKVTYEFNKATKDYTISFHTPQRKKYDYEIYTDIKLNCKIIDEEVIECYNIPINTYRLSIVGVTSTCDDLLKEETLKLPELNNYSEDPLCEGIEEFYLCRPTTEKQVDRETFESRVKTYKKTKLKKENEEKKQTAIKEENENKIVKYIRENIFQIIIYVIFLILILITTIITMKSIRKSRRLE